MAVFSAFGNGEVPLTWLTGRDDPVSHEENWLVRPLGGDRPKLLFCLPFAGSGASMYRNWPRVIGEFEVCPIQLPGRENRIREPSFGTYAEMAAAAAAALRPMLDRPFAMFGHCLGALTAHAIAAELAAAGGPTPFRLFVSAARAPHEGYFGPVPESLPPAALEAQVRCALAVSGDVDPMLELVEFAVATLKRDLKPFIARALPTPGAVQFAITAFSWIDDHSVSAGAMESWRDFGVVSSHALPGDHYTILRAPATLLAAILADGLDDTAEEHRRLPVQRVDIEAVERALIATGRVREAALVVAEEGPDQRIVAHIAADAVALPHDLRQALRREIPEWMIPDQWVQRDALPRTATGAVDVERLRELTPAALAFSPAENSIEAQVLDVWAALLPVDQVSTHDEFYDCGGNSLTAARIVRRLRSEFGVEISIASLQERTTPKDLARLILAHRQGLATCDVHSDKG